MKYNSKFIWCILVGISLSGCGWFWGSGSTSSHKRQSPLPKVTTVQEPGGNGRNWRYLGLSDDSQLINEINESSIQSTDKPLIYSYQDRKTVANINKFTAYVAGQPHYKFLISNWQMDCNTKQYLILNSTLYDELGVTQLTYNYVNGNNVKWVKIGGGSLAELQYNYICLNQKRNLGY